MSCSPATPRGRGAGLGRGKIYGMLGGRLAAEAVDRFCATGDARELALPRQRFMKMHGQVFWILGAMQRFWYVSWGNRIWTRHA